MMLLKAGSVWNGYLVVGILANSVAVEKNGRREVLSSDLIETNLQLIGRR